MLLSHPHFAGLSAFPLHRSHLAFEVGPDMLTPAPALHAGYLYAASDLASYVALLSLLTHDESAVTHDLHVSVMSSARAGDRVDIRAEVVRRGRTLAFMDVRASCGDRLLSTARVTKSMMGPNR